MKSAVKSLTLMLAVMFAGCTEETIYPVADFTFQDQATSSFTMATYDESLLVNQSTHVQSVSWDFGDGTTSAERDTKLSYEKSGTYDVTMTVTHTNGTQSIVKKTVVVKDRVLTSINIARVQWDVVNTNGWPPTTEADIYLQIQEYTDADMNAGYICTTCPVIYTSSVLENVGHHTLEPMVIPVTEKFIVDKKLIQFAVPDNLNKAYLISLMARDNDGKEYVLVNNRTGYFGILRENFAANEFIVQGGPNTDYTLKCDFE